MNKEVIKKKAESEQIIEDKKNRHLILINDDIHTFDYVSRMLIEVCNHTMEQAIQCTTITHCKGRCSVKNGNFETLRSMRKALIERELKAVIT
jgi:ATP-dependent Clp protease adaptor protein ClpS